MYRDWSEKTFRTFNRPKMNTNPAVDASNANSNPISFVDHSLYNIRKHNISHPIFIKSTNIDKCPVLVRKSIHSLERHLINKYTKVAAVYITSNISTKYSCGVCNVEDAYTVSFRAIRIVFKDDVRH